MICKDLYYVKISIRWVFRDLKLHGKLYEGKNNLKTKILL